MTKETLIAAGGNLWKKKNMSRVYLNTSAIKKAFNFDIVAAAKSNMQKKSLKKTKIWVDLDDMSVHSDIGTVRVMFNQNDIECSE